MLPTPSTSHVNFSTIYEPAEDSFLLLDTLSSQIEISWIQNHFKSYIPLILEIGPGSGVVIAFLTANSKCIFGNNIISFSIDINFDATIATQQTVQKAIEDENSKSLYLGSIRGDLCTMVKSKSIDVLVFNPPYVPSERIPEMDENLKENKFERESRLLELSYAGGKDGMETTERLLNQIPEILSDHGIAYILLCKQNNPEKVKTNIQNWNSTNDHKWYTKTVGTSGKRAGWEKLEIIRIWRE